MPPKNVGNISDPYSIKLHFMLFIFTMSRKEIEDNAQEYPFQIPRTKTVGDSFSPHQWLLLICNHSKTITLTCTVMRISFDSKMLSNLRKYPITRNVVSQTHLLQWRTVHTIWETMVSERSFLCSSRPVLKSNSWAWNMILWEYIALRSDQREKSQHPSGLAKGVSPVCWQDTPNLLRKC